MSEIYSLNDWGLCAHFITGYVGVRTDGSSSQHKLPTSSEILQVVGKYFTCGEKVLQALDAHGAFHRYGPYYASEEVEVL